jgi:Apoptosis inhibitory protein 5 (API5)
VRRLAIKELPTFCKDTKENTPKISDILAQLLNAAEPTEVQQVNLSLQALSKVRINFNILLS